MPPRRNPLCETHDAVERELGLIRKLLIAVLVTSSLGATGSWTAAEAAPILQRALTVLLGPSVAAASAALDEQNKP